jgi:lipoyl(octanoyl) transferase
MMGRLIVRDLGRQPYLPVWQAMLRFTDMRHAASGEGSVTEDELWLVQHDPVFTLGQAGKPEHVLAAGDIPLVQSDRGGQVTYHGPGQLVAYPLIDLRRKKLGVRDYVSALENATIEMLSSYAVRALAKPEAPGVYVDGAKIMALGIRVRHGCTLHGLALNVCGDLEPFARINPCGYVGLRVTSVYDEGGPADFDVVTQALLPCLAKHLQGDVERSTAMPEVLR